MFQQSAAVHGTTIDARMQQVLEASRKSTGSPALNLNAFSLQVGGAPPVVTTLAGGGSGNYADGAGTSAAFHYPWGLAYDSSAGLLFVTDDENCLVRSVVVSTGVVSTLAGGEGSTVCGSSNGVVQSAHRTYLRQH